MDENILIQILKERGALHPCSACDHDSFTLVKGDFAAQFLVWGKTLLTGGYRSSLEYIVLVCDNCGLMRCHALKPLGLSSMLRRV